MNKIYSRIQKLRELMIRDHIDYVYVPTDDYHLSETVGDFFKCREYITGFNGSAGVFLISLDKAYLWTDSRYFIQASNQLKDTGVELFKMGEEGVPTLFEFLNDNIKENEVIALDCSVIDVAFGKRLSSLLDNKNAKSINKDYFVELWEDRPSISKKEGFSLPVSLTGISRNKKIKTIQNKLIEDNADSTLIASLDDIMWILNIRGRDVEHSPVILSYLLIERENVTLYCFEEALSLKMRKDLQKDNILIKDYYDVYTDILSVTDACVVVDSNRVNYALYSKLEQNNKILLKSNYSQILKAMKNKTEVRNMKKAHIKDAVSMIKFIYYVKHNKDYMSEISLADKLIELRSIHDSFIEPSFESIIGFKEHGAIVHYSANEETNVQVTTDSFLLVDSGGQYLEGTTDITRTIVLGNITREMKKHFTLVLKGHLSLYNLKFLRGTNGASLDMLVRKPLWDNGLNYGHGTGHGVGCLLNCHEGPNSISFNRAGQAMLPGMITSNEPGLYIENKYGIRHENLMVCVKVRNSDLPFYRFEQLTYVPFDLKGIDKKLLTKEEIDTLNRYHKDVYQKISPYLSPKERRWLKSQTKEL